MPLTTIFGRKRATHNPGISYLVTHRAQSEQPLVYSGGTTWRLRSRDRHVNRCGTHMRRLPAPGPARSCDSGRHIRLPFGCHWCKVTRRGGTEEDREKTITE
ncbi:hypothetical protein NDU88_002106 [Pleurodeles waltl]|uniref:Uncharacterized protein n=1 Tax=Pleurodeles waltl TaxID=8319 RepID=A0AAV7VYE0_PLEWA|nr:hypothetical protein NDU88_002106 [Pleurodeles waltl]